MARQIINVRGETSAHGKIRFHCAFWIARSLGTVTWRAPQSSSIVPDATAPELAELASGAVVEVAYTTRWHPIVPGMPDARAELIAAYQDKLAAITNEEVLSDQFGGWSWNGTSWSAPDPFSPPAAEPPVNTIRRFEAMGPAAGVSPGTAITTTPPFSLHNPVGSNRILRLVELRFGRVSGTLGVGNIVYAQAAQATTPANGTALTETCSLIGHSATPVATAHQGSTLSVVPTFKRPGMAIGGNPSGVQLTKDCLERTLDVMPGHAFSIHAVGAAGTSPLVVFCAIWDEIPLS